MSGFKNGDDFDGCKPCAPRTLLIGPPYFAREANLISFIQALFQFTPILDFGAIFKTRACGEYIGSYNGPPPLIFTLGSLAVHAANDFYELSQRLTLDLSQRAILLTGKDIGLPLSENIVVRSYLPHSQVFPRCTVLIHHGGIGTTGQALIAGRPQLVVPHLGDQWDNGARIERLGVGHMLDARKYTYPLAKEKIETLLNNQAIIKKAKKIGKNIKDKNGAENAASLISETISSLNS